MSYFSLEIVVPGTRIKNSPAAVNRGTGVLLLNQDTWHTFSPDQQAFIRYHEEGHLVLNTTSELSADGYAFEKMMSEGRSLQACVKALTELLTESEGHRLRALVMLNRAKAWDFINKKNTTLMSTRHLTKFNYFGKKKKKQPSGRKQARQAKRADKAVNKKERRAVKTDKKRANNENRRSRAQSRLILAEQGKNMGLGAIAEGVGGILSGGRDNTPPAVLQDAMAAPPAGALRQAEPDTDTAEAQKQSRAAQARAAAEAAAEAAAGYPPAADPAKQKPDKKNNTGMVIGIVLAGLLLAGLIVFLVTRKTRAV
jgi:hypothetical protein